MPGESYLPCLLCNIVISFVFKVVQMNKSPLIVTFVGSENCNTGHILSLEDEVDKYLEDYKSAVVESQ